MFILTDDGYVAASAIVRIDPKVERFGSREMKRLHYKFGDSLVTTFASVTEIDALLEND